MLLSLPLSLHDLSRSPLAYFPPNHYTFPFLSSLSYHILYFVLTFVWIESSTMYYIGGAVLLYCTELYCTALYWTVLYWTELNSTELKCTELNWTELNWTVLNWTVLYCTVLYCTELYWTELNWSELNWTELYCTVLNCTVLYCCVVQYCTVLLYCTVRKRCHVQRMIPLTHDHLYKFSILKFCISLHQYSIVKDLCLHFFFFLFLAFSWHNCYGTKSRWSRRKKN